MDQDITDIQAKLIVVRTVLAALVASQVSNLPAFDKQLRALLDFNDTTPPAPEQFRASLEDAINSFMVMVKDQRRP